MNGNALLLTGVYRSGTTLLSCMLGSHPDINFSYGMVNYLRWYVKRNVDPKNYKFIVADVSSRLLKRFNKELNSDKIINNLSQNSNINHAEIFYEIMSEFYSNKSTYWGEKTLLEWSNSTIFLSMFSNAKVIHIVRDPRDVLASFKEMTFEPGNRYLDAIFAAKHSMNTAVRFKAQLNENSYLVVKYEDLILKPENELKNICDFLKLKYNHSMLNEDLYLDQLGNKFKKTAHSSYGANKKLFGRWKEKLNQSEKDLTESLIYEEMEHFGYSVDPQNSKRIRECLNLISSEPLLQQRFITFMQTGNGVEEYPSDPLREENWTVINEGNAVSAKKMYLKNK
ncbi:MAG: sulfotransferase family protein [Paracoccaceae bacterium]